ncbi:GntR family transcriptional regulator [Salisaeta longa]|uniref:GntR family transcriptional regulator n=1 Tax=Salisaeta longa TaxID=503170 RepID=UPI0003B33677|nr:GntR family transcriptional regulator [Salisaeta longa]
MELESGRPRHEQISDWLRARITDETYGVDEQLPSEKALGEMFGVSRVTVRRALQTLEHEGLIYRQQGLGSFVQERRPPQGLVRLTDFAQDMAQAGLEARSVVKHQAPEPVPAAVARRLDVAPDTTVIRLDRLRLGDEQPIAFDRTWLPPFYAQLLEGHDLARETIYGILEGSYDIPVLRGRYRIGAAHADDEAAAALDVPSGQAVLQIDRCSFTTADKPIYFQTRYYRSDRVAYIVELERTASEAYDAGMPLRDFEPVFQSDTSDA